MVQGMGKLTHEVRNPFLSAWEARSSASYRPARFFPINHPNRKNSPASLVRDLRSVRKALSTISPGALASMCLISSGSGADKGRSPPSSNAECPLYRRDGDIGPTHAPEPQSGGCSRAARHRLRPRCERLELQHAYRNFGQAAHPQHDARLENVRPQTPRVFGYRKDRVVRSLSLSQRVNAFSSRTGISPRRRMLLAMSAGAISPVR